MGGTSATNFGEPFDMFGNALLDISNRLGSCSANGAVLSEVEVIGCFNDVGTGSSFLASFSLDTTIPGAFAFVLFFCLEPENGSTRILFMSRPPFRKSVSSSSEDTLEDFLVELRISSVSRTRFPMILFFSLASSRAATLDSGIGAPTPSLLIQSSDNFHKVPIINHYRSVNAVTNFDGR